MNSKLPNMPKPVQISDFVSFKEPTAGLLASRGYLKNIDDQFLSSDHGICF